MVGTGASQRRTEHQEARHQCSSSIHLPLPRVPQHKGVLKQLRQAGFHSPPTERIFRNRHTLARCHTEPHFHATSSVCPQGHRSDQTAQAWGHEPSCLQPQPTSVFVALTSSPMPTVSTGVGEKPGKTQQKHQVQVQLQQNLSLLRFFQFVWKFHDRMLVELPEVYELLSMRGSF
jgi:hypothetical protein